jgi:flagellar hook-associated protein 3 FlgL
MRVSTSSLYEAGVGGMLRLQEQQLRLQQQLSTGRRINSPADDPVAAAAALEIGQAQSMQAQFGRNIENARSALLAEEQALGDVSRVLQDVKTLAVNAGNAALSDSDRRALAVELQGRHDELLAVANRRDGHGQYLFSGFKADTPPFLQTAGGAVIYQGDEGQRLAQIGTNRRVAVNDSGAAVFMTVREGDGRIVANAAPANTGSAIVGAATIGNEAAWNDPANPREFSIRFHVDASVTPARTTYDIVDAVNNVSLLTGAAPAPGPHPRGYAEGALIVLRTQAPPDSNPLPFDFGASVTLSGAPASGDSVGLRAAATRDLFGVVSDLIATLRGGHSGTAAAAYRNRLDTALTEIDNALDHVLLVRAGAGNRLAELDTAQTAAEDAVLDHQRNLSRLQDLDYAAALSDLAQRQTQLEAVQKSFLQITRLRLFDFI